MREYKEIQGVFANVRHRGTMWHATLALNACVARLGLWMNHLKYFRDPIRRFESLGDFSGTSLQVWGPGVQFTPN